MKMQTFDKIFFSPSVNSIKQKLSADDEQYTYI